MRPARAERSCGGSQVVNGAGLKLRLSDEKRSVSMIVTRCRRDPVAERLRGFESHPPQVLRNVGTFVSP